MAKTIDDIVDEILLFLENNLINNDVLIVRHGQLRRHRSLQGRSIYDHIRKNYKRLGYKSSKKAWECIIRSIHRKNPRFLYFQYRTMKETKSISLTFIVQSLSSFLLKTYYYSQKKVRVVMHWEILRKREGYKIYRCVRRNFKNLGFHSVKAAWQKIIQICQKKHAELRFFRYENYTWTREEILKEAAKYNTRGLWLKKSKGSYAAAKKFGKKFFNSCCIHMSDGIGSFSNNELAYFYILESKNYFKVGKAKVHNDRPRELNIKHKSVTVYRSRPMNAAYISMKESEWKSQTKVFCYINRRRKKENFKIPWKVNEPAKKRIDGYTETFPKKEKYICGF